MVLVILVVSSQTMYIHVSHGIIVPVVVVAAFIAATGSVENYAISDVGFVYVNDIT